MIRLLVIFLSIPLFAFSQSIAIPGSSVQWHSAASSACGVLFCENFEGWTNYSRNGSAPYNRVVNDGWVATWTTSSAPGSTITNTSTSGLSLEGTNCLEMIDPGGDHPSMCSPAFAAQSECWVYLEFRSHVLGNPDTAFGSVQFLNASSNNVAKVHVNATGQVTVFNGTVSSTTAVTTMVVDTTYFIWFHFASGSGANGVSSVGFNTAASRPTVGNNYKEVTTGDATTSAVYLRVSVGNPNGDQFFDKIRIYSGATPPPDNPS